SSVGNLSIANGANLLLHADLTVTGNLALDTQLNTGANTLALSCSSRVAGASVSNYIVGNLQKSFCTASEFLYPTGTASGYSPINATVASRCANPAALAVKANQGNRTGMDSAQSAQRFWTLTKTGDLTANLLFNYL